MLYTYIQTILVHQSLVNFSYHSSNSLKKSKLSPLYRTVISNIYVGKHMQFMKKQKKNQLMAETRTEKTTETKSI